MNNLSKILNLEDIKVLRFRYCRYIDEHRWDDLREVLSPDCVLDLSGTAPLLVGEGAPPKPPVKGRENIVSFLESRFGNWKMVLHICTMPEIYFDAEEKARGIWRQETYIKEAYPDIGSCGIAYGTVHDEYVKLDGRWYIDSVRVTLNMIL